MQVISRPMFGAFGEAGSANSIAFVSKARLSLSFTLCIHAQNFMHLLHYISLDFKQAALEEGIKAKYGLNKRVEAVGNVRCLTKLDMKLNDALPNIKVDPESYTVEADGEVLTCAEATSVPLSRNYFLF